MAEAATKSITLPEIVDLDALDPVRDTLIEAVETGPVAIRAGAVERVCTNALLMLISAAETSRRNNFSFELAGASEPLLAAIDRLGLTEHFAGMMKGQ